MTLLAFQEGFRSVPLTGTYDMTPPEITAAAIKADSISLTFNESNLKNAGQEGNYRFSPSLNFRTLGGLDDIARIDDVSYRLSMKSIPQHEIVTLTLSGITDAAGNRVDSTPLTLNDGDADRIAILDERVREALRNEAEAYEKLAHTGAMCQVPRCAGHPDAEYRDRHGTQQEGAG